MSVQTEDQPINIKDLVIDKPVKAGKEFNPDSLVSAEQWQKIIVAINRYAKEDLRDNSGPTIFDLLNIQILKPDALTNEEKSELLDIAQDWLTHSIPVLSIWKLNQLATAMLLVDPDRPIRHMIPYNAPAQAKISHDNIYTNLARGYNAKGLEELDKYLEALVQSRVMAPNQSLESELNVYDWWLLKGNIDKTVPILKQNALQALGWKLFAPSEVFAFTPDDSLIKASDEAAELRGRNLSLGDITDFLTFQATTKILLADELNLDLELKVVYHPVQLESGELSLPAKRRF